MDYTSKSDELLIREFIAGNNSSFDILYERVKTKLYSYLLHLTRNEELANDLFQDTFFRVIQTLKINGYKEEGKFLQWVMRIAHNLFIDLCRKKSKVYFIEPIDAETDIFDFIIITDNIDIGSFDRKETVNLVRRLVEKLPPEQKEVLIMRHYLDMSFKEIAEKTNTSINTALGRMRYALMNMRKMLRNHLYKYQ